MLMDGSLSKECMGGRSPVLEERNEGYLCEVKQWVSRIFESNTVGSDLEKDASARIICLELVTLTIENLDA